MSTVSLDRFVWAAGFFGNLGLLLVLFNRHRARSFPAFTLLIAESLATTVALYFLSHRVSLHAYRYTNWSLGIVDEIVQLLVCYEIAVHVFCPTGVWPRGVRRMFITLSCASIAVAFLLTWLAHPSAGYPIQRFIVRSNFFSAALISELFVGMVVLSSTSGLPWKTHVARIAQGLGAFSLVCVAMDIVVNSIGLSNHRALFTELARLRALTYIGCETFWIVMLWQQAPEPRELPEVMRNQIFSLQKQVEYELIRIRTWSGN